jgi:hypothetical protein
VEPDEPALAGIDILAELGDALSLAFGMFWEILWALILGFAIPAAVQAVVAPSSRSGSSCSKRADDAKQATWCAPFGSDALNTSGGLDRRRSWIDAGDSA